MKIKIFFICRVSIQNPSDKKIRASPEIAITYREATLVIAMAPIFSEKLVAPLPVPKIPDKTQPFKSFFISCSELASLGSYFKPFLDQHSRILVEDIFDHLIFLH